MPQPFAVIVSRTRGPEVLEARPIALPVPGDDQVVIEHTMVSVNYVDICLRSGWRCARRPSPSWRIQPST